MSEPQSKSSSDPDRWAYEINRENAHRQHDSNRELFHYVNKATLECANLALKTLVLINGGAAIAVLTFLGGVSAKQTIDFSKVGVVAATIKWFAFGVALAVAGMALSYLTSYTMAGAITNMKAIYERPFLVEGPKFKVWRRWNIGFHIVGLFVAIASLVFFLIGMFSASDAVKHLLATT
jgi:hypothetical protein